MNGGEVVSEIGRGWGVTGCNFYVYYSSNYLSENEEVKNMNTAHPAHQSKVAVFKT